MKRWLTVGLLVAGTTSATAFERDVHFGLTEWLATQAGYTNVQARAIGIGDQRVDSGDIPYMQFASAYACARIDADAATRVQEHHYPGSVRAPAPPADRAVAAGSPAAARAGDEIVKVEPSKASFTLYKLGEALHVLQDSYAHQGVPDVPRPLGEALPCDPRLAWGAPAARGGAHAHRAELTAPWPADTLAMAAASYALLTRYPPIDGAARQPKPWAELRPQLDGFVVGRTKAEKRRWFVDKGFDDVAFLAGTSLPDGDTAFRLEWKGDRLPPLRGLQSRQLGVASELLTFLDGVVARWTGGDDFERMADEFRGAAASVKASAAPGAAAASAELAARLAVWRLADHGSAAALAHLPTPYSAAQRKTIAALARRDGGLARHADPSGGLYPILPNTAEPSPLLPYLVAELPPAPDGRARAVATLRFRHAPYDSLELLVEKGVAGWSLVTIGSIVEP